MGSCPYFRAIHYTCLLLIVTEETLQIKEIKLINMKEEIEDIINNAINDFDRKWQSHDERRDGVSEYADQVVNLFNKPLVSDSVCKCPLCGEEMKGIELTHYKCKKCNEYFTN